jgi:site-specific recombinase XerD
MVEAVLAHAAATGELAPSTLAEFTDVMGRFARFIERGLRISGVSAIGEPQVQAFVSSRQVDGRPPSLSRMHNRRTVCRYLFRTAISLGLCDSDPTARLELPPRTPVPARPLTDDEMAACRSRALFHPADLLHPVAWALAEATARTYEIARVLVGDVDLQSGTVRLGGSPRTDARAVAFTEWGLTQVNRRLSAGGNALDDRLFPVRSRKVPRASASMAVIEVLRVAGIKASDVRPISVVGWRGARAYTEGASIEEVAALLGLTSLDRTAVLIGAGPTSRLA